MLNSEQEVAGELILAGAVAGPGIRLMRDGVASLHNDLRRRLPNMAEDSKTFRRAL